MVRVEADEKGIRATLTDGYLPDFQYFQNLDWDAAKMNYLSLNQDHQYRFKVNCQKYLYPQKNPPSKRVQANIHKHLIQSITDRFCDFNRNPYVQINFPAQADRKYDRKIVVNGKKYMDYKVLPFCEQIKTEIEKDIPDEKNYFFNVTLMDARSHNSCPMDINCFEKWIEFMNFKVKDEQDYLDFEGYKNAAESLLKYYIDLMH